MHLLFLIAQELTSASEDTGSQEVIDTESF